MIAAVAALAIASLQVPTTREIDFKGAGGFELHGSFIAPTSTGKSPCVLLIPGSGPTDRDGNQLPGLVSNLLKQIAERLAAQGVASFRFDKRAVPRVYMAEWPKGDEDYNRFMDFDNFVADAKAAFLTMKAQPEADPNRAGVIGHSEGTLLSLVFSSQLPPSDKPKTLVLLGAPGRTVGVILKQQLLELFERQKLAPDAIKRNMDDANRAIDQLVKDGTVPSDLPNTPLFRALFQPRTTRMMHGLCSTDPLPLARAFPGPVLLITGEYDQEVSPTLDTAPLEGAFKSRRNGEVKSFIAPHGSHSLKEAPDRDHDTFAGPVIPAAMDEICAWIKAKL